MIDKVRLPAGGLHPLLLIFNILPSSLARAVFAPLIHLGAPILNPFISFWAGAVPGHETAHRRLLDSD